MIKGSVAASVAILFLLLLMLNLFTSPWSTTSANTFSASSLFSKIRDGVAGNTNAELYNYRLSDVVLGDPDAIKYIKYFRHSIGDVYLNRTAAAGHRGSKVRDMDTLCGIVRERGRVSNPDLPTKNATVVHLRLGDTVGLNSIDLLWEAGGTLRNQMGQSYIHPKMYYEGLEKMMPPSATVVIVVGSSILHNKWSADKVDPQGSYAYRERVAQFFEDSGYKVERRFSESIHPDVDFTFMSHSTYFIQGGGGYSKFISQCVQKFGGRLVGSTFTPSVIKSVP